MPALTKRSGLIVASVVLAVLTLQTNSSVAKPQRFLWGPYRGLSQYNTPGELAAYLARWVDTLKCNFIWEDIRNSANASACVQKGIRFFASDSTTYWNGEEWDYLPGQRGYMALQHYLAWQTDSASIPPWLQCPTCGDPDKYGWRWIQGRRQIVSGDTLWSVDSTLGDTRGWVIKGPWSYCKFRTSLDHRAEFKVKFQGISNLAATDTLAVFHAKRWGGGSHDENYVSLDSLVLLRGQATADTQTVSLSWTNATTPASGWLCFPIYWYGRGQLLIDEVVSKTPLGDSIVHNSPSCNWDELLKDHAASQTFGTGDSLVGIWNLEDEATAPENYSVLFAIDSVLRTATGHAPAMVVNPGTQADACFRETPYALIKIAAPKWYFSSDYPLIGSGATLRVADGDCGYEIIDGPISFSSDYDGPDSTNLQHILSADLYNRRADRKMVDTAGAPYGTRSLINVQAFRRRIDGAYQWRPPSCYEGRCLVNLAMAYGADGVMLWRAYSEVQADTNTLWTGGLFYGDTPSPLFDTLKTYVAPFIDMVGDLLYDLKWIDADGSESVGMIASGCVDSLRSLTILPPRAPYVQVGFFEDTAAGGAASKYFMLVNRRCLASDTQHVQVWLSSSKLGTGMKYVIDMYSNDTVLTGSYPSTGNIPFTTFLGPGEGRLFKIVSLVSSTVSGHTLPQTWQGGIAVGGNVTVDSNRIMTVLAPAEIRVTSGGSYAFNVYGSLATEGLVADTSVTFRSANLSTPGRSDWYGIKQLGPGNVTLKNTQIRDAYCGLRITSTSTVDTVTVDHCDIRHGQMVGIYSEANSSSKVSIVNSHISDIVSYGVEVYKGQATLQGNRFTDSMLYGVFVYGSPSWTSGAKILANFFDSLRTSNAWGIYLQTLYNDGYSSSDTLIQYNTFGPTWLSGGQGSIQISNCSDSGGVQVYRTSVRSDWLTLPTYGIMNYSTKTRILGDHAVAESLSAIQGPRYAVYLASTSGNDPDYAKLRNISIRAGHAEATPGYCVWVYSNSKVDAGTQSDPGGNALYGYSCGGCPNCLSLDAGASTVYNNRTNYTDSARGNYWGNRICPYPPVQNSSWPYSYGLVDTAGTLSSNPFVSPLGKLNSDIAEIHAELAELKPTQFSAANYPNPFNSGTVIEFSLANAAVVDVAIFNILGQLVRKLWHGEMAAGQYSIPWDGRDARGNDVASGMYFYRIASPQSQITKKMVVVK